MLGQGKRIEPVISTALNVQPVQLVHAVGEIAWEASFVSCQQHELTPVNLNQTLIRTRIPIPNTNATSLQNTKNETEGVLGVWKHRYVAN